MFPTGKTGFGRFFSGLKAFGLEMYGLYYGMYRGIVVSNEDPQGVGRIKVRVPALGQKKTDWMWAWPKFPGPCGKVDDDSYGFYFPPPADGEMVWVEFEVGRVKHPVYTGGWWGKDELPGKVADAAPRAWAMWSLAQHYLTFIDKEDAEEVELAWMAKHKLTMDKDHVLLTTENGTQVELNADGTLAIKDENDNEITTSGSGTEVKAGQAKVVLQDGNAEIHAKTFTWGPGGLTSGAKAMARGEDLVKVLRDLTIILQNFGVDGAAGKSTTDVATKAQLIPIITRLQKTLVPTFKV